MPKKTVAETAVKNTKFQKGQPGGPGRGNKPPLPPTDLLADMEAVLAGAHPKEDGPVRARVRKLFYDDLSKFIAQLTALRKATTEAAAAQKQVATVATAVGPDEGEERIEQLIGQLAQKWESEKGEVLGGGASDSPDDAEAGDAQGGAVEGG